MANSQFRVGGHYTAFTYNGKPLIYAQMISERGPQPVAQPIPIQPLDAAYPIEIALPAALEAGTLEITFLEQWNAEVWAQMSSANENFNNAADLLDIFKAQLNQQEIQCIKVISKPDGSQRAVTYHGCVITNAQIDETIQIGTMTIPKTITIMYRQRTETTIATVPNLYSTYNGAISNGATL
jgi:hypothetical protein